MALSALISALEGPISFDFRQHPDTSVDTQLSPHIRAALNDAPTACVLQPQLQAFGWDPDHGFVRGRPDLRALASRLRHQCHERIDLIGEGTYSTVYRARDHMTGDIVTMKVMRLFPNDEADGVPAHALREVSLLRCLRHPNIVSLRDVLWERSRLYLVMEYVQTDLLQYSRCMRGQLLMPVVKRLMWQLMKGVQYLHARRVLHRDLKPANLLIDPPSLTLKIADFGLARAFTPPVRPYTHEVVTQYYRAPELLLGCEHYGKPLDMWSIGCIFAELVQGAPLFADACEIGQLYKIFRMLGTPDATVWPGIEELPDWQPGFPKWQRQDLTQVLPDLARQDPDGMDLLLQLLTYDPAARITARRALRHPFFAQCVREEAAGGGAGEAAAAGLLAVELEGVNGYRPAAEGNAAADQGCEPPPIPAATAAKPPLPRFAPSKRQCLRSACLVKPSAGVGPSLASD